MIKALSVTLIFVLFLGLFVSGEDILEIYPVFSEKPTAYPLVTDTYQKIKSYENTPFLQLHKESGVLSPVLGQKGTDKNFDWPVKYDYITVYGCSGQTAVIHKNELANYLELGWCESYEETITPIFDRYGTQDTVYKDEARKLIENGFFVPQNEIDPQKPMIAITFDDGPGIYTDTILDSLEKYGARATFFVLGHLAEKYPEAVARAQSLGCEIGNHSYSHALMTDLGYDDVSSQIKSTSDSILNAAGVAPRLFRPPYGRYNGTIIKTCGMPLILWSIDTCDWNTSNVDSTVNAVISKIKDGEIVLMHDIYESSAEAAIKLIPMLMSWGYQLVTVSELAEYKGKTLAAGEAYERIK